jgi:hypothetical protein
MRSLKLPARCVRISCAFLALPDAFIAVSKEPRDHSIVSMMSESTTNISQKRHKQAPATRLNNNNNKHAYAGIPVIVLHI